MSLMYAVTRKRYGPSYSLTTVRQFIGFLGKNVSKLSSIYIGKLDETSIQWKLNLSILCFFTAAIDSGEDRL